MAVGVYKQKGGGSGISLGGVLNTVKSAFSGGGGESADSSGGSGANEALSWISSAKQSAPKRTDPIDTKNVHMVKQGDGGGGLALIGKIVGSYYGGQGGGAAGGAIGSQLAKNMRGPERQSIETTGGDAMIRRLNQLQETDHQTLANSTEPYDELYSEPDYLNRLRQLRYELG